MEEVATTYSGNAQSPNARFHIWNMEEDYARGMGQKMRGRSWHHLSWIWDFVGWKKAWEKSKCNLCNSKLCSLGHLEGLPAVLSHSLASMSWKWLRAVTKYSARKCKEDTGVQLSPAPGLFLGIPSQVHCLSLFQSHGLLPCACGLPKQNRNKNQNKTSQPWRNGF